jgi:3-dehydroquinate dehydratase/shikimate dehydrogenase
VNKGKICVSVCAETVDEMIVNMKRAEQCADVIEVRFDSLSKSDFNMDSNEVPQGWRAIRSATTKPLISTYRAENQGGYQHLTEKERLVFWYGGMETEFADVEDDIASEAVTQFFDHYIISHHDLVRVPPNLESIYDRLASTSRIQTVKIAVQAADITDTIPVWNLLDKKNPSSKPVIPIAIGEAGKWTRILGLAHGSFLTYASLEEGMETADGQITAKDLIETYRVKDIDLNTKVYGVIGDPVSESLSPYIHNPAFAAQNINAVFIPMQVKDLDGFIRRMVRPETREVELNFGGFAVTMPHKQAIIKHLEIDPTAETIRAVNTVKIDGGKLTGYNTDAYGFITPLREKFGDLNGSRIAVIGAGGAARACIFALKQENADVTVFARDMQKGKTLASDFSIPFKQLNTDRRPPTTDLDIVVDATPLGMKGPFENESLFTADQLKGVKFVYDLVTSRTDTPLIREAKKANVPAIGGFEMLIYQAAKQFEIWTGREAPIDLMRQSAEERTK